MSILHNIISYFFDSIESKKDRYYRDCEEAFRRSEEKKMSSEQ